eukprot:1136842-Pelagomonas_calceolata.AAC.6
MGARKLDNIQGGEHQEVEGNGEARLNLRGSKIELQQEPLALQVVSFCGSGKPSFVPGLTIQTYVLSTLPFVESGVAAATHAVSRNSFNVSILADDDVRATVDTERKLTIPMPGCDG